MIRGLLKADALAVGEIHIELMRDKNLSVKAALVSSEEGSTHGWTTAGAGHGGPEWSPAVWARVEELREQLEVELAALHMREVNAVDEAKNSGGIGEDLQDDAPSV